MCHRLNTKHQPSYRIPCFIHPLAHYQLPAPTPERLPPIDAPCTQCLRHSDPMHRPDARARSVRLPCALGTPPTSAKSSWLEPPPPRAWQRPGGPTAAAVAAVAEAAPPHPAPRRRLLTRRARNALGTATQCTRRNDSPPPPPPPPAVEETVVVRKPGICLMSSS
jgi:hypothetical protein